MSILRNKSYKFVALKAFSEYQWYAIIAVVVMVLMIGWSAVASLLNIPMMFYAFDLYDYIASRDFYYDFEGFVPGKIVFSENELINAINKKDFESEKVDGFKNKFFDDLDGKSSERVTDLILENLDI